MSLIRGTNLAQGHFEYPKDWGQGSRGILACGGHGGEQNWTRRIDYITIATNANSVQFGENTGSSASCYGGVAGASGRGRGILAGGHNNAGTGSMTYYNDINFITIAVPGNSTTFGDLTRVTTHAAAVSNGTRALICGGRNKWNTLSGTTYSDMTYINIATPSNATTYGNITSGAIGGMESGTASTGPCVDATGNGIYGMVQCQNGNFDYMNIAVNSNSHRFGNLSTSRQNHTYGGAVSNGTRAIWTTGDSGKMEVMTWETPAVATLFAKYYTVNGHSAYRNVGCDDGSSGILWGGISAGKAIFRFPMDYVGSSSAMIGTDIGDFYCPYSIDRWDTTSFAGN